jgi:predicted DNA-binding transcriptional regulator AlpA
MAEQTEPTLVVDAQAAARLIGVSKAQLFRMVKRGTFPKPLDMDARISRWMRETIEAWLRARARLSA